MPRVSEKQLIIKWFLKSIELQIQHKGSESLWEALEGTNFSDSGTPETPETSENSENLENSEDFNSTSSSLFSISGTLSNSTSFGEIEEEEDLANWMLFVKLFVSKKYIIGGIQPSTAISLTIARTDIFRNFQVWIPLLLTPMKMELVRIRGYEYSGWRKY